MEEEKQDIKTAEQVVDDMDIFGYGIPIYTINRYFEEIDAPFDDGSHIVYVNGSYKGEDVIGKLMHDFGCKKSRDMYYPELAKGMKHFKEEEGGRKIMCERLKNMQKDMQISDKDKSILLKRL